MTPDSGDVEATASFKYTYNESAGRVSMTEIPIIPCECGAYRLTTINDGTSANNASVISSNVLIINLDNYSGVATTYTFTK